MRQKFKCYLQQLKIFCSYVCLVDSGKWSEDDYSKLSSINAGLWHEFCKHLCRTCLASKEDLEKYPDLVALLLLFEASLDLEAVFVNVRHWYAKKLQLNKPSICWNILSSSFKLFVPQHKTDPRTGHHQGRESQDLERKARCVLLSHSGGRELIQAESQ